MKNLIVLVYLEQFSIRNSAVIVHVIYTKRKT